MKLRQQYRKTRPVAAAAAVVLAAGLAFVGTTAASASPRPAAAQARPQTSSVPYPGQFNGTAIAPGGTAWAVGYEPGLALAERFNGKGSPTHDLCRRWNRQCEPGAPKAAANDR